MKLAARTSRAAQATAWPWLPALAVTTPAARSSSDRVAIVLTAPRSWVSASRNELESRVTRIEVKLESILDMLKALTKRVTIQEYVSKGLIYGVTTLATSKSGDLADTLLQLLKVMKP
mgnify:CR=1 FL=1